MELRLPRLSLKKFTWLRRTDTPDLLKHLCFFTHNTVQYWPAPGGDALEQGRLKEVVARLPAIAGEFGLEIRGGTIDEVRRAFIGSAVVYDDSHSGTGRGHEIPGRPGKQKEAER